MANKRIERIRTIDRKLCESLAAVGIETTKDFLGANLFSLVGQVDESISYDDLVRCRHQIAASIAPKCTSALQLYNQRTASHPPQQQLQLQQLYVPTGLPRLDSLLQGGLRTGTITEAVGPPGIGKSQLCMGAALTLLCSTTDKGVVYIDTELKFDPWRLAQMLSKQLRASSASEVDMMLNRVKVLRPLNSAEFVEAIQSLEDIVVANSVGLIIIDSIAMIARKQIVDELDKEILLVRTANELLRLADLMQLSVLVTNQIAGLGVGAHASASANVGVAVDSNSSTLDAVSSAASSYSFQPALGMIWSHCITTRLYCSSMNPIDDSSNSNRCATRYIAIDKHPSVATTGNAVVVHYCVQDTGLVELPQSNS